MIIGKIETFPRRIPFKPGNHVTASAWGDKDLPAADSLLVKVTTDEGLEGWSETFGFRAVSSAKLAIDAPLCIADARNTNWEDSASHTTAHNRLTDFGKEDVHEVNRLGMVVDLAQLCDQTFYDALAVTTAPMILSHSLIRAISNVPRNMTDEMLRALAKNGGVIGINFGMGFINPREAEGLRSTTDTEAEGPSLRGRVRDEYAAENAQKLFGKRAKMVATVDDVADHIDHAVKIAGIDHVGIGNDFDGIAATANALEDVSKMPSPVAFLLERGYSENDLKKS